MNTLPYQHFPLPFELQPDGFCQLCPEGDFVHKDERGTVIQRVDEAACAAMAADFAEKAKAPDFPGVLIDYDHFSLDPNKSSEAAGWMLELQHRPGQGLWFRPRWTEKGLRDVTGGNFRYISPVWFPKDCETLPDGALRPLRFFNAGLTNIPNIKGAQPMTNKDADPAAIAARPPPAGFAAACAMFARPLAHRYDPLYRGAFSNRTWASDAQRKAVMARLHDGDGSTSPGVGDGTSGGQPAALNTPSAATPPAAARGRVPPVLMPDIQKAKPDATATSGGEQPKKTQAELEAIFEAHIYRDPNTGTPYMKNPDGTPSKALAMMGDDGMPFDPETVGASPIPPAAPPVQTQAEAEQAAWPDKKKAAHAKLKELEAERAALDALLKSEPPKPRTFEQIDVRELRARLLKEGKSFPEIDAAAAEAKATNDARTKDLLALKLAARKSVRTQSQKAAAEQKALEQVAKDNAAALIHWRTEKAQAVKAAGKLDAKIVGAKATFENAPAVAAAKAPHSTAGSIALAERKAELAAEARQAKFDNQQRMEAMRIAAKAEAAAKRQAATAERAAALGAKKKKSADAKAAAVLGGQDDGRFPGL